MIENIRQFRNVCALLSVERCYEVSSPEISLQKPYVHLNPVAAGLSRHPGEWPFSNYLEWIEERNGALVDHDWIRYYFPSPASYIQFVNSELSAKMEEQLKPYLLE